jgi:uncharacterized OB-fold protein
MLPALTQENRPFFTTPNELRVQQCSACGAVQHPPGEICNECGGMEFTYRVVEAAGQVESFTVVHHAVHPMLKAAVPYNVAVVVLRDHPNVHIVGNVVGVEPGDLEIGMPVVGTWASVTNRDEETLHLLQWERAE